MLSWPKVEFASCFQGMDFLPKVINFLGFANNTNKTASSLSWSESQVESKSFNVIGFKVPEFHHFNRLKFLPFSESNLNIYFE